MGDTAFKKISNMLATALESYTPYCLSTGNDAWMQMLSRHANTASDTPAGFKCDN